MSWTDLRFEPFGLVCRQSLRRYESALNPNLRQDLRVFSPTGILFKRNDVHPRKFLPLVEMLKAKHYSLWSSLSSSKQEKLLTLLEQIKPEEQERLLRVVEKQGCISHPRVYDMYMSTDNVDKLLSLLTCLHSTDRSNLLRLLESMNPQEQEKLIRVMGRLEWVELLAILDDLKALEQKILLNVMLNTYYCDLMMVLKVMKTLLPVDRSRLLRLLDGLDIISQHKLLRVLEHSSQCHELMDRSNLLRRLESMDRQEQKKLICVMHGLEESEWVELLGILDELEVLEQQILLSVLNAMYPVVHYETALKFMKTLLPVDQSRLLRLLDGLDSTSPRRLLKVLEHSSQCPELIDLVRQEHTKFISMMGSVQKSEWVELFGILDELEAPEQQILLNVLDSYENLTKVLVPLDWLRLLRILIGLDSVQQDLLLKVLEQTSRRHELIETMDRLKPQEQLQLLRVMLVRVDSPVKLSITIDEILSSPVRMSEMIDQHQQQQQLKRVLRELGCLQQKYNLAVHSMDDARLLSKAANLMYLRLQQREGRLSLDRSSLQQCLDKLEPLERKQLPRVLSRLNVSGLSQQVALLYEEELKGVDVRSMLSDAYELLMQMEYECLLQRLLLMFVCLLSIYLSETDPQSGLRNLLLDGWWLEFWEIILLVAGDVERNPGPRQMSDEELRKIDARVLEEDDLVDVYKAVYDCRPKWHNLCLNLRIHPRKLSAISGDTASCLREGLTLWLQRNYDTDTHGPPSWRMLVDAVADSAGGNDHALALEIAEKHKALTNVPPQLQLQIVDRSREARRRSEEMSSSFNNMYRSVIQRLRNIDVGEVKEYLRYLTDPQEFDKLCVPPRVYKRAATTKDLLDRLCPQYINPGNTFVLEEIVEKFGSRRCKRLVREYVSKFM